MKDAAKQREIEVALMSETDQQNQCKNESLVKASRMVDENEIFVKEKHMKLEETAQNLCKERII